ncbi:MAG: peptidoglycan bridge formation glycyltransferase FemA/FemB family protein [Candidatus Peribacteraceae bacterium]|nr:peptidoglycan bridge formation glycyltransferase FemA/FemB family protein [Candidatus Peribacteraceae bacterium]
MDIRLLSSAADFTAYEQWVRAHPQGSLWQSLAWKRFQDGLGRATRIYAAMEEGKIIASALVVIDRTSFGLSTWDIPRGPIAALSCERSAVSLLEKVIEQARRERCLSLFCSACISFKAQSFKLKASHRHEQPDTTRVLDLTQTEEALLAQMHPKGRYNIKVAQRHGVRVERSGDVRAFHTLLQGTGERDRFTIRPLRHYRAFLDTVPGSFLLLAYPNAETKEEPVAGLLGVIWNGTGIYYYGASSSAHRNLMAPYLLQWEAMKHCKAAGCGSYDLLGIAPPDAPATHPWNGVSAFKEKFGGTVVSYPPEQQIVVRPVLNGLLRLKRKILG